MEDNVQFSISAQPRTQKHTNTRHLQHLFDASTGPTWAGTPKTGIKVLRSQAMKTEFTNVCKASLALVAGWFFAGWLLFFLIAWVALLSQA